MFDRYEPAGSEGAWAKSAQPGDLSLAGMDSAQRQELLSLFPELRGKRGRDDYTAASGTLKSWQARLLTEV